MTVTEVATALRVSRNTIYRLINTGALRGCGVGRTMRVSRTVIEALIRRSETPGNRSTGRCRGRSSGRT